MKIWVFCLITLLLQSCDSQAPRNSHPKNTINLNFSYDPLTLDPRKNGDPVSSALIFMLYEGLTHLEEDGSVSLCLAKHVNMSKDRLSYTFSLIDACWSDGSPITAYDFERSWKNILDPDFSSPSAYLLYPIKNAKLIKNGEKNIEEAGIHAIDAKTLLIELQYPAPFFLQLVAFAVFFAVPKEQDLGHVFSGPFILKKWVHDRELSLEKNQFFWNAEKVKLEEIFISFIKNEETALNLFEQNYLDWIGGFISPLPIDSIDSLKKRGSLIIRPVAGTAFCTFNTHSFPFNNVFIRKAFAYAIDRREIVENITQLDEEIALGLVPTIFKKNKKGYFSDGSTKLARYYFERGLQELGLKKEDFPKITFSYYQNELQEKIVLSLQEQWSKVLGVHVDLEKLDVKVFLDKLYKKQYHIAKMSAFAQYFDPMNLLERFMKKEEVKNYAGWSNSEFLELIQKSAVSLEAKERLFVLEEAEKILINEMPIAPIYFFNFVYMKNKNLQNSYISPIGVFDFRYAYFEN